MQFCSLQPVVLGMILWGRMRREWQAARKDCRDVGSAGCAGCDAGLMLACSLACGVKEQAAPCFSRTSSPPCRSLKRQHCLTRPLCAAASTTWTACWPTSTPAPGQAGQLHCCCGAQHAWFEGRRAQLAVNWVLAHRWLISTRLLPPPGLQNPFLVTERSAPKTK